MAPWDLPMDPPLNMHDSGSADFACCDDHMHDSGSADFACCDDHIVPVNYYTLKNMSP